MKILALELSSPRGSIAWHEIGQEPFSTSFANDRKHSGLFFENLELCLKRFGNPERIAVGLGPGSYAGTRIAIATATGLGAVSGAQLIGVPSFCAMETEARQYAVIGDARRRSFFFARVGDRRCLEGPVLYTEEELAERLKNIPSPIFATEPFAPFAVAETTHPAALILAVIATTMHENIASTPLEPIYLRDPHITYAKARPAVSNMR